MVGGGVDGLGGGAPRPSSLGPPAAAVAMAPAVTPLSSMSRLSAPLSASPVSSALSLSLYILLMSFSLSMSLSLLEPYPILTEVALFLDSLSFPAF